MDLLRTSTDHSNRQLARFLDASQPTVSRASPRRAGWMRVVEQVIGDPRFSGMEAMDFAIRRYPAWRSRFGDKKADDWG